MYIKKIEVENGQIHSKLDLEFVNGVNVICGASRTGKSCLRRLIDWTVTNKKIDKIRKSGTKKTSVKIYFSNNITLEKVRSQTINRYILTVGEEVKEFNSIGKEVPKEIQDVLKLNPIVIDKDELNLNIAPQVTLPFLLDKPGSFRMKLFNLLTGNDLQDKLLGSFNKTLLNLGRQIKSQEENLDVAENDLIVLEKDRKQFKKVFESFKKSYEKIKKDKEKLDRLIEIQEDLEINQEELESLKTQLKSCKIVDLSIFSELVNNAQKLEKLESSLESLSKTQTQINDLRNQLKQVNLIEIDSGKLEHQIKTLDTLKSWSETNNAINEEKKNLEIELEEAEIDFEQLEGEYKNLLKEAKICPVCNGKITDDCLKEIKL